MILDRGPDFLGAVFESCSEDPISLNEDPIARSSLTRGSDCCLKLKSEVPICPRGPDPVPTVFPILEPRFRFVPEDPIPFLELGTALETALGTAFG